jgi:hypothetical protein
MAYDASAVGAAAAVTTTLLADVCFRPPSPDTGAVGLTFLTRVDAFCTRIKRLVAKGHAGAVSALPHTLWIQTCGKCATSQFPRA